MKAQRTLRKGCIKTGVKNGKLFFVSSCMGGENF
jgi:hypothetical protein